MRSESIALQQEQSKSWLLRLRTYGSPFLVMVVVVAYLLAVARGQGYASFGFFHDDTLYFASAKALASHQGFANPSIPGSPAQSKYPILYPALLSFVWRVNPHFPENLTYALWLTAAFGAVLVVGWFFLLRDLGVRFWEALFITAIFALHPFVLMYAGAVMSDLPAMAFAVWATLFAGRSLESRQILFWLASAGCSVAAALTRSIGIAVVAGILAWAVYRRDFRWSFLFAAATVPAIAAGFWWSQRHQPVLDGLPGYRQTLLFYTSYADFWKLCVPDLSSFAAVVGSNLMEVLRTPALLVFALPHLGANSQSVFALLISAAMVEGLYVWGQKQNWHPVFFIFALYSGILVLWNYPLYKQSLVFFVPLFLLGTAAQVRALVAGRRKIAIVAFSVLLVEAAHGYVWGARAQVAQTAEYRRAVGVEKLQAYEWIRKNTNSRDRFISYEDANLYLHTARQGLRPIAVSSEANYRNTAAVVSRDLGKLTDTARQIQARYWLVSDDDYLMEPGAEVLQQETERLLKPFPVVFRSSSGRVTIYEYDAR